MVDSPYLSWYLHYADKACKCGWSCLRMKKPSVSGCQQLKTANSDVFRSTWGCFWYHIWCLDTKKPPWLDNLVPQKWPADNAYNSWTMRTLWQCHPNRHQCCQLSPLDHPHQLTQLSPLDHPHQLTYAYVYTKAHVIYVYIYKQHILYLHYDHVDIIREYICEQQHVYIYRYGYEV